MKLLATFTAAMLSLTATGCVLVFLANGDGQPIKITVTDDEDNVVEMVDLPAFDGNFNELLDNPIFLEPGSYNFEAADGDGNPFDNGTCELTVGTTGTFAVVWAFGELRCGELSEISNFFPQP